MLVSWQACIDLWEYVSGSTAAKGLRLSSGCTNVKCVVSTGSGTVNERLTQSSGPECIKGLPLAITFRSPALIYTVVDAVHLV